MIPFIDLEGNLPPVSEVRNFGLMLDLRSRTLKTYDELNRVVDFNLGGNLDISGYVGMNQPISNPPVGCPAHVALGNLNTLLDVVMHIYYSSKSSGLTVPIPKGIPTVQRTVNMDPTANSLIHMSTASRPIEGYIYHEYYSGTVYSDSSAVELWLSSKVPFLGKKFFRFAIRDAGSSVGIRADVDGLITDLDYSAIDDPSTHGNMLIFDGTTVSFGHGPNQQIAFAAALNDKIDVAIDTVTGEVWLGLNGVWRNDPTADPATTMLNAGLKWKFTCKSVSANTEFVEIHSGDSSDVTPAPTGFSFVNSFSVSKLYLAFKKHLDGTRVRLMKSNGDAVDTCFLCKEASKHNLISRVMNVTSRVPWGETAAWVHGNYSVTEYLDHVDLPTDLLMCLEDNEFVACELSVATGSPIYKYSHVSLGDYYTHPLQETLPVPFLTYKILPVETFSRAYNAWLNSGE